MTLTEAQKCEFVERGFVKLSGLLGARCPGIMVTNKID
ncbi:hypothetical protein OP10G_2173 [Fimbriimonas ginsengisoli Gsoil 348]|uniref:Uncharacterized protein n=1 Tax=Fimbriimonas ginsengisoli Gsoil 348 TaxID=661478 RepID=A0A068NQ74_FIMGI|nr:hypothetical protein OP10G_2173 [Fimbriimonas ginsengisoli Gsoil 348]